MLKETKTEETILFFMTFLSLVAFQLGGPGPLSLPSAYVYPPKKNCPRLDKISCTCTVVPKPGGDGGIYSSNNLTVYPLAI